jgi:Na+/melibiose symporter-like transporter
MLILISVSTLCSISDFLFSYLSTMEVFQRRGKKVRLKWVRDFEKGTNSDIWCKMLLLMSFLCSISAFLFSYGSFSEKGKREF